MEEAKKMTALTVEELEKAQSMDVDELSKLFKQDTAEDISLRNKAIEESEANKKFMVASRGIGNAINDFLMDYSHLMKKWPEILASLDIQGFKRKIATSSIPLASGWAKKSMQAQIDKTILEALPNLLLELLTVSQKGQNRLDVQRTSVLQAQTAAEQSYSSLAEEMIRLRNLAKQKFQEFEAARKELQEIDEKLKNKDSLSEEEYALLTRKRTGLVSQDNDRDIALQTMTQELRATEDGYLMTELQIGQLTTALRSINSLSTMMRAFLRVTEPIMKRSIVILNAQKAGIDAANLLYALSETMNHTLKVCSYGNTVMTQQAIQLGNKDFLKKTTVEEVKAIQKANDKVWADFTKAQYEKVMEKVQPLLMYIEQAGSTEKQPV